MDVSKDGQKTGTSKKEETPGIRQKKRKSKSGCKSPRLKLFLKSRSVSKTKSPKSKRMSVSPLAAAATTTVLSATVGGSSTAKKKMSLPKVDTVSKPTEVSSLLTPATVCSSSSLPSAISMRLSPPPFDKMPLFSVSPTAQTHIGTSTTTSTGTAAIVTTIANAATVTSATLAVPRVDKHTVDGSSAKTGDLELYDDLLNTVSMASVCTTATKGTSVSLPAIEQLSDIGMGKKKKPAEDSTTQSEKTELVSTTFSSASVKEKEHIKKDIKEEDTTHIDIGTQTESQRNTTVINESSKKKKTEDEKTSQKKSESASNSNSDAMKFDFEMWNALFDDSGEVNGQLMSGLMRSHFELPLTGVFQADALMAILTLLIASFVDRPSAFRLPLCARRGVVKFLVECLSKDQALRWLSAPFSRLTAVDVPFFAEHMPLSNSSDQRKSSSSKWKQTEVERESQRSHSTLSSSSSSVVADTGAFSFSGEKSAISSADSVCEKAGDVKMTATSNSIKKRSVESSTNAIGAMAVDETEAEQTSASGMQCVGRTETVEDSGSSNEEEAEQRIEELQLERDVRWFDKYLERLCAVAKVYAKEVARDEVIGGVVRVNEGDDDSDTEDSHTPERLRIDVEVDNPLCSCSLPPLQSLIDSTDESAAITEKTMKSVDATTDFSESSPVADGNLQQANDSMLSASVETKTSTTAMDEMVSKKSATIAGKSDDSSEIPLIGGIGTVVGKSSSGWLSKKSAADSKKRSGRRKAKKRKASAVDSANGSSVSSSNSNGGSGKERKRRRVWKRPTISKPKSSATRKEPMTVCCGGNLEALLKCVSCKQWAKDAHTVNECLHTYCRQCAVDFFDDCVKQKKAALCLGCAPPQLVGSGDPKSLFAKVMRPDKMKQALIEHMSAL